MKKILLIVPRTLDKLGGTQTYNEYLIKIINNNFQDIQIDYFVFSDNEEENINNIYDNVHYKYIKHPILKKRTIFNKFFFMLKENRNIRKEVYKLYKKNNYDLILDSSNIYFSKIKNKKQYFFIQHYDIKNYLRKISGIKSFISYIYFRSILNIGNFIKNSSNIVVYDNNNLEYVKNITKNKIYTIPLCFENNNLSYENINISERNKIIYLGRLDSKQKNIDKLISINKNLNLIDFYGKSDQPYDLQYEQIIKQNHWYKGIIRDDFNKIDTIKNYRFMILYSNYEGFSFSLVEALSQGVPIIVKNTYLSASFLCNEQTGLLLDRDSSIQDDIKKIRIFYDMSNEEYKKYVKSCLEFYNENLTFKKFEENWMKIFVKYLK